MIKLNEISKNNPLIVSWFSNCFFNTSINNTIHIYRCRVLCDLCCIINYWATFHIICWPKIFIVPCENLISANKTTLSSNAILRFSGIFSVIIAAILLLGGISVIFTGEIEQSLTFLLYALILYISAGTLF